MYPTHGYSGVLNVFEETFTKETVLIRKAQEEEFSLWEKFKQQFSNIVLFIISKGETGSNVFLSTEEIASITQFLRWAQYSLLSGFNVPPRKISDFISNIPTFIGNSTLEVFYVGIEPDDEICIVVTAPVKFYDFRHEFLFPIDRRDFDNRKKQLYDDILNSTWPVNCFKEGMRYEAAHSIADIIKCGSFDAFMLKFINSSQVVKQLFMKYYKELNLRGIIQKLKSLENDMLVKRDILSGMVPIDMQKEHKRLRDLKMRFQQADSCVPIPVEQNIDLYRESLLTGILFSEEKQQFYLSKKYEINMSSATFWMEFYNRYCLNYNMEKNILPAIMNVSLKEDFNSGENFLKARFRALDLEFKEKLLSRDKVREIEDVICKKMEYEKYLDKIESIEYDQELHQMRISGSLTEREYSQLTKHLDHGTVDVIYEQGYILLKFSSNLSSILEQSKILSEIKDKQSSEYSDLDLYLSRDVYMKPENKSNLRQQERVYNKLMLLKAELKQLRIAGKTVFDIERGNNINQVFEDILHKVQATLFASIDYILSNEG